MAPKGYPGRERGGMVEESSGRKKGNKKGRVESKQHEEEKDMGGRRSPTCKEKEEYRTRVWQVA